MARKRTPQRGQSRQRPVENTYGAAETFDDSEDEFYADRDKVLLEEEPAAKRRRVIKEQEQALQPSDEEILGYDDDNYEDVDQADDARDDDEDIEPYNVEGDDDDNFWGTSRADYYGADDINEEAEALEEEAEAKRLRQKQLENMTEADFGFDETEWTSPIGKEVKHGTVVEKLPDLDIPGDASEEDKLRILSSRYPEFDLLAKDLVGLQQTLVHLTNTANATQGQSFDILPPTQVVKCHALVSYLSSISMYFTILSSAHTDTGKPLEPLRLRTHTVMQNLARSRLLWDRAKDLEDCKPRHAVEVNGYNIQKTKQQSATLKRAKSTTGKEELAPASTMQKPSRQKKLPEAVSSIDKPRKKKTQKTDRFDLQKLLKQSAIDGAEDQDSDFGDEVPLTEEQAAEKAKKRKSLRFYTSQISQKSNKRNTATREAGGDDDLPYKERFRDKQKRLMEEAERRGKQKASAREQLDDADVMNEDGEGEDDNEYYDMVAAKTQQKKADKQARAAAYAEAERQGGQVFEEEHVGSDGKRAITYAIAKNKGLAPKRKKEVRNPRVKKRKRYDEKMKKLGSIRQVYKGGEGRGGYGGELTGIKTNVVKSTKL